MTDTSFKIDSLQSEVQALRRENSQLQVYWRNIIPCIYLELI